MITTPDCEALYYNRVLSLPSKCTSFFKIFKYGRAYWQYLNVARSLPVENCRYHLVGWRDKEYLTAINPILDADFIPHPHYPYNTERIIKFNRPKIRLLIPGRYDFIVRKQ